MPKKLPPTMKRSINVESDIYERLMCHIGDSPGAFSDFMRRLMRQAVDSLDRRAAARLSPQTQQFIQNLLDLNEEPSDGPEKP